MRCPFLREAQVKFCRASAYKKMIVRLPEQPDNERCSSKEYVQCPAVKQHLEELPIIDHCPFLQESLVQYCTAAAVTKYIPYSESINSQCGTDSHRYCDLYLAIAHPGNTTSMAHSQTMPPHDGEEYLIDDIRLPSGLWFSSNHMWLDVSPDGILHVGLDGLMTKILGKIDRLTFVTTKGVQRPTVVVTVNGVDLHLMFPNSINITRANTYLRTNPQKIFSDPYHLGWLFEGTDERSGKESTTAGLVRGGDALTWMSNEIQRMNTITHELSSRPDMHGAVLMADGGSFQTGIAHHLRRDDVLSLFNDFFSPFTHRRFEQ
ncbi:MAG: hypothetical protein WCT99_00735 [Bacteroidota bacterium]|jgi:glycine cleavage system H protein